MVSKNSPVFLYALYTILHQQVAYLSSTLCCQYIYFEKAHNIQVEPENPHLF